MSKVDISKMVDEIAESFAADDDTTNALDDFARGFISKRELGDRLEFLLTCARQRVENAYLGPAEPDDALARPGTWERDSA